MTHPALRIEGISKQFHLGSGVRSYRTLRESINNLFTQPLTRFRQWFGKTSTSVDDHDTQSTVWALKDVSFEVQPGEVVGIVGRNGAGKSTLLKILTRITQPTEGYAEIRGRLGSLLEVGTGFHPELTGRENIYLNGAILGMRKREIDASFDDIVSFAEIGPFLDTPVKRYSSGMAVRLAFAVAAHLDPEILIIDEVLAVGDSAFQKKCIRKMNEKAREGRTVLFVSHNISAVQSLCTKCVMLEHGRLVAMGPTNDVVQTYLQSFQDQVDVDLSRRLDRSGNQDFTFTKLTFERDDGTPATTFFSGEDIQIRLNYQRPETASADDFVRICISIKDNFDSTLFLCCNELTNQHPKSSWPSTGSMTCRIPRVPLPAGSYQIDISAVVGCELADLVSGAAQFDIENADYFETGQIVPGYILSSRFLVPHSWDFDRAA